MTRKNVLALLVLVPSLRSRSITSGPTRLYNLNRNPCISTTTRIFALKSKLKTVSVSISQRGAKRTQSHSNDSKSKISAYKEEAPNNQKTKAIWFPLNGSTQWTRSTRLKRHIWKVKTSTKNCISSRNNSQNYMLHQLFRFRKLKSILIKLSNLLRMFP